MNIFLSSSDSLKYGEFSAGGTMSPVPGSGESEIIDTFPDKGSIRAAYASSVSGKINITGGGSVHGMAVATNVVSLQSDLQTGRMFWVESPVNTVGGVRSFNTSSKIYSCAIAGGNKVEFAPASNASSLVFCLDMKLSPVTTALLISSANQNKIFSFDRHSGAFIKEFSHPAMMFPTTIAIDHVTGSFFARCHSVYSGLEAIVKFEDGGPTLMFEIAGTVPFSTLSASYESGSEYPFLGTSSMKYDHVRKKLVWLSNDGSLYVFDETSASARRIA